MNRKGAAIRSKREGEGRAGKGGRRTPCGVWGTELPEAERWARRFEMLKDGPCTTSQSRPGADGSGSELPVSAGIHGK